MSATGLGSPQRGGDLPVYVIHAGFMADRRESITRQLDAAGIAFEFVLANDPGSFDPSLVEKYLPNDRALRPGATSCLLKHLATYETIVSRQQREALILEDDVLLEPDFRARLAAVRAEAATLPRPRSIQLGAANNRYTPASQLRPGRFLYPAKRVRATEAYLIGAEEAAIYLAAIGERRKPYPIDLQLNGVHRALAIKIYWAEPPLLFQGSMTGRFSSAIEHAPRHRNRLYNRIKFTAHRFGKYHFRRFLSRLRPPPSP